MRVGVIALKTGVSFSRYRAFGLKYGMNNRRIAMLCNVIFMREKLSRTTVTAPKSLPIESMVELETKSKTAAAVKAIREEIRLKNIGKIKAMAGKIEFLKSADEIRHDEEWLG